MIKRIILIRHAKSSWEDSFLNDHDRPLANRGINDASLIGKYLNSNDLKPDLILSSTAKRASMTAELILNEFDKNIDINYNENLYLMGSNTIIDIISKCNDKIVTLMIVGHNPDMETLVEKLTKTHLPYRKFSTAGTAVIEFNIKSWNEINESIGKLVLFITPKMLKN